MSIILCLKVPIMCILSQRFRNHLSVTTRYQDSGGSKGGAVGPHPGFQILSISCTFWKKLAKSYVGPSRGLAPAPRGNPGSATTRVQLS